MSAAPVVSTQCSLCGHPRRAEFEVMLAEGTSQVTVAALAGVSQPAVSRHLAHHVRLTTAALERAARGLLPKLVLEAEDPRVRLTELREMLLRGMRVAETAEELGKLPRFAREIFRCIELELRYGGDGRPAVDREAVAAEQRGAIKALAGMVLVALSDHPEARERVADALARMAATEGEA